MEVLFVTHKYPPSTGGMEKQSFELINGAALYTHIHTLIYDKEKQHIVYFFATLNKRIKGIIKQNPKIKLIHFNDGLIASLATFHTGYDHLKKVATIHGLDIVFPLPYFQRKIIPRFNTFDKVIAVSHATATAAIDRGIDSHRVTVIDNGVDQHLAVETPLSFSDLQQKYPPLRTPKYFITLGRPVKRKGFSWLLKRVLPQLKGEFQLIMIGPFDRQVTWTERLLQLLPKRLYSLITLFIGYPTDQKEIRSQLQKKAHQVLHLGKIPFEDLKALLAHATAFLMPNIRVQGDMEGFGLVCLEASVSKTLVIASRLEGITNAIQHQKNGILLESENSDAWVSLLQEVIDQPTAYAQLAHQFKTYSLETFSWDKMARAYISEFSTLCKE